MPRWVARLLCNWHRSRARRLLALAEKQTQELTRVVERAERHEHRAKHWDFVAHRRRGHEIRLDAAIASLAPIPYA